jgi:hypothetical protein
MKTMLATFIVLIAFSSHGENMQDYLRDTQDMVQQGKYPEALERFIWFHDHALEHDSSMTGVRLSFALSYWKALGEVYPPAKTALIETRDHKEKIIMDKTGNRNLFHDVVALNRTLEENEKTVALFEVVDKQQPESAIKYWNVAKDSVIEAKRFDLAGKYINNPVGDFTKVKAMYDHNVTLYDNPQIGGDHFKAYNENRLVEQSLQLIEVALALDDLQSAKDIQTKALAVVNDNRLRDAIPSDKNKDAQHAPPAGRGEAPRP